MTETVADKFLHALRLAESKAQVDMALDAIFLAKLFKRGNPDDAHFYFRDHSGLHIVSRDDSEDMEVRVFMWADSQTEAIQ